MFLVVGLGNPGKEYEKTRHNAGFIAVERLASEYGIAIKKKECSALTGSGKILGQSVILAKPQTYMNRSGEAVRCLVKSYGIDLEKLIVIYDDIDLPLGKIRIRTRGGSGGHRGVASIIAELGTSDFPRIRLGIGRPEGRQADVVQYVLSPFETDEFELFLPSLEKMLEAIRLIFTRGFPTAMSIINAS